MQFQVVGSRQTYGTAQQQGIVIMARMGHKVAVTRRYRLRLPAGQKGVINFSPDGSKMLWTLWPQNDQQEKPSCVYTHWVSDLNGTHKRRLGAMPYDRTSMQGATQLQWLPDSKHIGFLYRNKAYTIATQ